MTGAVLLAVALAASGCTAASTTATSASPAHALTLATAQQVYRSYVTASTAAARQGDAKQGLALAGDMQWAYLHAQYLALTNTNTPVTQYRYGQPVYYVPALADFPFWFVVQVPVQVQGGGQLGPEKTMVMVFQRFEASRTWSLDGTAILDQPLPAIARDSAGYAQPVSESDPDLLLRPDLVGATQAAVVDEGPTAPAAAAMTSGPHTTELYATNNAKDTAATAQGLNFIWLMQGATFDQYQLRAAAGGAVVLYAMYLNTTIEHPGNLAGSPIPVPANFIPLLTTAATAGTKGVTANWTYEFVAVDPPAAAHDAKVQIIGGTGSPTYGKPY